MLRGRAEVTRSLRDTLGPGCAGPSPEKLCRHRQRREGGALRRWGRASPSRGAAGPQVGPGAPLLSSGRPERRQVVATSTTSSQPGRLLPPALNLQTSERPRFTDGAFQQRTKSWVQNGNRVRPGVPGRKQPPSHPISSQAPGAPDDRSLAPTLCPLQPPARILFACRVSLMSLSQAGLGGS